MKIKENINRNIFRGYDIRGVYPTEIDADTAYTIGLGFGSYIKSIGKTTCVLGHDNRLSGEELYNALSTGILETGIDIISLGLCTTPMYYYACIKLGVYSGVMVTASHNPKDDNGFKFAFDEKGNCKGQEIQDFLAYIEKGEFATGQGKVTNYDITNDYLELFKNNLHFGPRRIKVVIDPGNGATSVIAKELYSMFPIDLISINDISDGTFPNHHPDPCVEANLEQLKAKVKEVGADIGLGFDGDGDRMGVISNSLEFIPTDYYMIAIIRDIINKVDKKEFLYDVKCSKSLSDEIEKLGGKGICYRTGNSYTKAKVREEDLPFGGELSGHVYFRDRWPGFDSGLYAGLRLLEILSHTDKTVDELLEGITRYHSTEELKFKSTDDKKFQIVNKIEEYAKSKNYNYLNIDGVKVLFDDGWALVRASNTGPNLTARFEAKTEDRLEQLQKEFISLIEDIINKDIIVKKNEALENKEQPPKQQNKKTKYIMIGTAICIILLLAVTLPSIIDNKKTKDNETEEKNNDYQSEEQIDNETTIEEEQAESPNEETPEQTPNSTETYEDPSGPTEPIETSGNITKAEIKKYSRLINSFIINTKTNDDSVTYLKYSVANYHFEDFIKNTNKFKNLVTMNFTNWTKTTGETICSQEKLKSVLVCTDDMIKYNLNGYATKAEVDKVSQELFGTNAKEIEPFYDGFYGEWYYDKDKKIYYQGHPRGGGTGNGFDIFYKSKFEKTNNNIFVYMVAASVGLSDYETGDYKVYKSILKNTEAEEYGTFNEKNNVFKITKENYKDFEEYKITFKKHDTLDTYYFEKVEQTK